MKRNHFKQTSSFKPAHASIFSDIRSLYYTKNMFIYHLYILDTHSPNISLCERWIDFKTVGWVFLNTWID